MSTAVRHAMPQVVDASGWPSLAVPGVRLDDEAFVQAAGYAGQALPAAVHQALIDVADHAPASGALLLKGVPVGELPATPPSPTAPTHKDLMSEFHLLTVARRLGQPVGYEPEHGGDLVQNLVPTQAGADRQVSTSSRVNLMFHTEAAFHPHRPRYLLLLCLRGDPKAFTTLASISQVLPHLPPRVVETLFQPRFRTAVDESYLHGRTNVLGAPVAVLTGERHAPSMVFDEDLMVGTDTEADAALHTLGEAVVEHQIAVALEAGDLLVVDNNVAVHGRTPYSPRFDGTDRWLQRAMVVADLALSAGQRRGRVITTVFGA